MRVLHRLWADEAGFVISTELVLVATILVIGMVVGLASVRESVVAEMADLAASIGSVNQSYVWSDIVGHASATAGSHFQDDTDFCDTGDDDNPTGDEQCVVVSGDQDYEESSDPTPVNPPPPSG